MPYNETMSELSSREVAAAEVDQQLKASEQGVPAVKNKDMESVSLVSGPLFGKKEVYVVDSAMSELTGDEITDLPPEEAVNFLAGRIDEGNIKDVVKYLPYLYKLYETRIN